MGFSTCVCHIILHFTFFAGDTHIVLTLFSAYFISIEKIIHNQSVCIGSPCNVFLTRCRALVSWHLLPRLYKIPHICIKAMKIEFSKIRDFQSTLEYFVRKQIVSTFDGIHWIIHVPRFEWIPNMDHYTFPGSKNNIFFFPSA